MSIGRGYAVYVYEEDSSERDEDRVPVESVEAVVGALFKSLGVGFARFISLFSCFSPGSCPLSLREVRLNTDPIAFD